MEFQYVQSSRKIIHDKPRSTVSFWWLQSSSRRFLFDSDALLCYSKGYTYIIPRAFNMQCISEIQPDPNKCFVWPLDKGHRRSGAVIESEVDIDTHTNARCGNYGSSLRIRNSEPPMRFFLYSLGDLWNLHLTDIQFNCRVQGYGNVSYIRGGLIHIKSNNLQRFFSRTFLKQC